MISCEKENLKNLILDMANRLHSDVALTCAHGGGLSPTCLQPLITAARCTKSWESKAARLPAFPYQQLPAFSPAAACSWSCTMQRHDALSHARAGLLFTTSFSFPSWEHEHLYGLFQELTLFLLSCLPHSHFEHDQGHAEVSEEFPLALNSFL